MVVTRVRVAWPGRFRHASVGACDDGAAVGSGCVYCRIVGGERRFIVQSERNIRPYRHAGQVRSRPQSKMRSIRHMGLRVIVSIVQF